MNKIELTALIEGEKKNGGGKWYRMNLKTHDKNGKLVTHEYFLDSDVAEKMIRDGLIEDVSVNVSLGLDEYLRPKVTSVTRAEETSAPVAKKAV